FGPCQWGGLFVVDRATLRKVRALKGGGRAAATVAASEARQFEVLMRSNAAFLASRRAVVGGIGLVISSVTLALSYQQLSETHGPEHTLRSWSFAGGAVAATG